jgi:hypothetical protein
VSLAALGLGSLAVVLGLIGITMAPNEIAVLAMGVFSVVVGSAAVIVTLVAMGRNELR